MKRILIAIAFLTTSAFAQVGGVATELAESVVKTLAQNSAKELAEVGGDAAVRAVIAKAASEGGEASARQVAVLCERFGPSAVQAMKAAPTRLAESFAKMPEDLVQAAVRAAAREPEVVAKLVAQLGDDALVVAAKHPGVGTAIAEKLGAQGVNLAKQLPTKDAVRLARSADEIASVAKSEQSAVFAKLQRNGGKALDYLERHPRILTTAAGVAVFLAVKDDLLGTKDAPGFVERMWTGTLDRFHQPLSVILFVVAALLFARVAFVVVKIVRFRRQQRDRR
jgi:hypothetical protein